MNPIAIWYHTVFVRGDPLDLVPSAFMITEEQMSEIERSGLMDACEEIFCGVNGGVESRHFAEAILPKSATKIYHGTNNHGECATIRALEQWLPGHEDWYVLYLHCKGATHPMGNPRTTNWRDCMMRHLVTNWWRCVSDLEYGYESVGCHWKTKQADGSQNLWAGNFWWAKASFLLTLPSIMDRERIKMSGLGSLESRYEAEVWIGNGPRLPRIKDYHPGWKLTATVH